MNTVPTITPGSITGMTGNDQRPVYFLKMGAGAQPTLTVKAEQKKPDGEISIKWSSKLMKNVNDSQVNTKIMSANEILLFKISARNFLAGEPNKLLALNENNIIWVKMPYLQGLSDANFWREDSRGFLLPTPALSSDVKNVLLKFSQSSVWTQLGKILAVDLFNGNADRFTSNGDWQNKGNVMFQNQGAGVIKVVGLDTFDPNSHSANLTIKTDHSNAELIILKTIPAMSVFAQKVIASVEQEICAGLRMANQNYFMVRSNDHLIKIESDSEGFLMSYKVDLVSGLIEGVNDLKIYLQAKKTSYQQRNNAQAQQPGNRIGGGPPNYPPPLPPRRQGGPPNRPPPQPPGYRPPVPNYQAPQPPGQQKSIPQGILDRMAYLGW